MKGSDLAGLDVRSIDDINRRFIGGVLVAGAVLFVMVQGWAARVPLTYDEPWYLDSVPLVDEHGFFTSAFLRSLPGPVGPLFTWVHWLLHPLTSGAVPWVRLVNPVLLVLASLLTAAALKISQRREHFVSAAAILAIPMTWPCTGMALTEVPSLLFYSAHLYAFFVSWRQAESTSPRLIAALVSGVCLGIAVLGRQPVLLTLGAVAVVGVLMTRMRLPSAIIGGVTLLICVPVFVIWGGLVPPQGMTDNVVKGFAPAHSLLAAAYCGLVMLILSPQRSWVDWRMLLGLMGGGVIVNLVFGFGAAVPMDTTVRSIVPASFMWIVERGFFGGLIGLAMVVIAVFLTEMFQRRRDVVFVFAAVALLSQIAAAAAVKHQFSSRYLYPVAPLFLVLADSYPCTRWTPVRYGLGIFIGAVSLVSYYLVAE
jgi:hypothetical protein